MRDRLKANPDIFQRLKILTAGNVLTISPLKPEILDAEANLYWQNSSNDDVKKYLPGAYVKDEKEAKTKVIERIQAMIVRDSILYCIRLSDSQFPIGYVSLNSPLSQNGLNEWSLDFWLNDEYQGKRVMVSSLMEVLGHMQAMEIEKVYAMVDEDNFKSKSLIEKFGFHFIERKEKDGREISVYILRLN